MTKHGTAIARQGTGISKQGIGNRNQGTGIMRQGTPLGVQGLVEWCGQGEYARRRCAGKRGKRN